MCELLRPSRLRLVYISKLFVEPLIESSILRTGHVLLLVLFMMSIIIFSKVSFDSSLDLDWVGERE